MTLFFITLLFLVWIGFLFALHRLAQQAQRLENELTEEEPDIDWYGVAG